MIIIYLLQGPIVQRLRRIVYTDETEVQLLVGPCFANDKKNRCAVIPRIKNKHSHNCTGYDYNFHCEFFS